MQPPFLDVVLRSIETLAKNHQLRSLSDADLLRQFLKDRDAQAFALIVQRHGPLVWGVCRSLLPQQQDAEDAFQATFLVLIDSAHTIRSGKVLASWLHGVAYRVATKAKRSAVRRKIREQKTSSQETLTPISEPTWEQLQTALHEEVAQLPDKLRVPFVLCDLEGRSQSLVAEQLGWKIGTLSGRICQARQRLLDQLSKRDIALSMAISTGVLSSALASAAPPEGLVQKLVEFFHGLRDASCVIPSSILQLSQGVQSMNGFKFKLSALIVVFGTMITGSGIAFLSNADAQTAKGTRASQETISSTEGGATNEGASTGGPGGMMGSASKSSSSVGKWQYRFIGMESNVLVDFKKTLEKEGQDGWEYCETRNDLTSKDGKPTGAVIVFKRPRPGSGGGFFAPNTGTGAMSGFGPLGGQNPFGGFPIGGGATAPYSQGGNSSTPSGLGSTGGATGSGGTSSSDTSSGSGGATKTAPKTKGSGGSGGGGSGGGTGGSGGTKGGPMGGGGNMSLGGMATPSMGGGMFGGGGLAKSVEQEIKIFPLQNTEANDLGKVIKQVFDEANIRVGIDDRSNQLVIRADKATLEKIEALVIRMDRPAPRKSKSP